MIFRKACNVALWGTIALSSLTVSAAWASPADEWNPVNSPARLEPDFIANFDRMSLESKVPVERMPYADTYWPTNRGSIAYRWNSREPIFAWKDPKQVASIEIFRYQSPTREQAMRMSRDQLAQLSPTEKYDLLRGKYDYPLTHEVLRKTNPYRAYWEGICHGWAPASVNHAEPMPVDVRNPDGVIVPFGSADVKAILDYMYATVGMRVRQMGKRCKINLDKSPESTDADCADVNAGAFHIVMANYIGLRHEAFVADIERGNEVWNNPIYAYSSKVIGTSGPAHESPPNTAKRVRIKTSVRYASDDEHLPPQWDATVGREEILVPDNTNDSIDVKAYADKYRYEQADYEYWLDLDAAGNIVGGEWISFARPDYVWMKNKLPFSGEFDALNQIYRPNYR